MPVLFETFVACWLSANLPFGFKAIAQYQAKLAADSDLNFRIDIVLEEKGRPLAVLDTKYKMHQSPSSEDIQAVVSYAVRMGTRKAFLIYPFTLSSPTRIRVGNIAVESVGFDLSGTLDKGGQKFLDEVLARCSESSLDAVDLR